MRARNFRNLLSPILLLVFACSAQALPCSDAKSPLGSLINFARADSPKTPLILIHGINGTKPSQSVTEIARLPNDPGWSDEYWREFIQNYWRNEASGLSRKYQLFVFKYCSNRKSVSEIADVLGREIDNKLRSLPYVIVAHSMGGLVAKAYMADYVHKRGAWTGETGGDTTRGIITLATPHHGTPGANNPLALAGYFPSSDWETKFERSNFLYWAGSARHRPLITLVSTVPNRSDLRWDNYDAALRLDANTWLANINPKFKKYSDKVILYAGALKPLEPDLSLFTIAVDKFWDRILDDHALLSFADGMFYFGLSRQFGYSDGLVPYKSAMLCDHDSRAVAELSCSSRFRVRRFEFGNPRVNVPSPNRNTLSIVRTAGGFDHKDMYESGLVLNKVRDDLLELVTANAPVNTELAVPIPTLFLFDVSGSMSENNKIEQARAAGLDALREMREEGAGSSPVSVMTFAGDCSPASAKRLMTFAPGLSTAENVMRGMLPSPDGATPLPQAKDAAFREVTNFLDANPATKEGRVILLSDGQSTCGEIRPPGVFSRQNLLVTGRTPSRVRYFTIGFDVAAGSAAERDLQYLASQTGGKYYNAKNREQLIRSLQKQVRVFVPRACNSSDPDFARGLTAFKDYDYAAAVEAFLKYTSVTPSDWCGFYNLALAYEAVDRYKKAAQNFQKYLDLAPTSPDRAKIEQRISRLRQDYAYQFGYLVDLIESDVGYLKNYYQSIFNRSSSELAEEFGGFVYEKREFYAMLPDILEIEERWLINDSKDIASSIDVLARRRSMESFDRDAVSLLTLPIAQMQDLTARLRQHQAGQF